jgi:nucleoside-diphosphate-sugar epimerase
MKILITGGLGLVGRPTVQYLLDHGYEVRVVDRQAGDCLDGVECAACDVTDFGAVREAVRGCQGVIHLAAIPVPFGLPAPDIFHINSVGTFNLYEAAAQEGIRRITTASSINWLGHYYGCKDFDIHYFPVDEGHPGFTTDVYSFSKQVTEDIAAYYWRREGISGTCLRLPGVYVADANFEQRVREWLPRSQTMIREWLELSAEEHTRRLTAQRAVFEQLRSQRFLEYSSEERQRRGLDLSNPDVRLFGAVGNFWTSVDARDAAQAFEKSLSADYEGFYPLFIHDDHNTTGVESEALLKLFYPEVIARTQPITGTQALVSNERARRVIGFRPEFSFERWFGA